MIHSGHGPGEFTSQCRACRLLGHLEASRATTGYTVARELVGRHIWSSGQRRAIKMAATLGVNIVDFNSWVEAEAAERNGR